MSLRTRCHALFTCFQKKPTATLQEAADMTGMSVSAAHRQKRALTRRNQHPESWLWETAEGAQWLVVVMCAAIYVFAIRGGIGMDLLSEFFRLIRLNTHLGVSATSLRRLTGQVEDLILQYQQQHVPQNPRHSSVIVGADETFFREVVLLLMDLCSGYIFVEETAANRTFLTWQEKARHALERAGVTVKYMVSDQAKALIKLALEELRCQRIPDLFHALHEVVKLFGGRFARKTASLQRKIAKAQLALESLRDRGASSDQIARHEQALRELHADHLRFQAGQRRYDDALHAISRHVHPFSLTTLSAQQTDKVKEALDQVLGTLHTLAEEYDIADSKHRLNKVTKQVPAIAALIDLWWLWVTESLAGYGLPSDLSEWLCHILLPSIYWQVQTQRTTSGPLRQAYHRAAKQADERLQAHPFTSILAAKELTRWQGWARWMVMKFQRTSSAVEGRNGVLSRMNHTQRSIPVRRLKVATVIHNFGIQREDGTTAAERLFGEKFPDLFTWIVEHMGELPCPRTKTAMTV
jgi:hypothetical protein